MIYFLLPKTTLLLQVTNVSQRQKQVCKFNENVINVNKNTSDKRKENLWVTLIATYAHPKKFFSFQVKKLRKEK